MAGQPALGHPIVVKIGGSTLGSHDTSLKDLVRLQEEGREVVVVHGGGNFGDLEACPRLANWLQWYGSACSG